MNKILYITLIFSFFVACKTNAVNPIINEPMDNPDTTHSTPDMHTVTGKAKTHKILALGDSYTIGESVSHSQRYPIQLVDSLKKLGYDVADPKIIARTGWTTDELASAIVSDGDTSHYDFVFLLIGVNNQFRGRTVSNYSPEFASLLATALKFAKNVKTHVFVISIPDYGYTPFGASNKATISAGIDAYNAENKSQALAEGVNYINITDISRSGVSGIVAGDGLHPSGLQYHKWVEKIIPVIKNYLE
jgi:lysophospholipase L1-like esterase